MYKMIIRFCNIHIIIRADLGGRKRGKFRQGGQQGGACPPLKFSGRGRHPLVFFQGGADYICPTLNIVVGSKFKNVLGMFSIIFFNLGIDNHFSVIKSPDNLSIFRNFNILARYARIYPVFQLKIPLKLTSYIKVYQNLCLGFKPLWLLVKVKLDSIKKYNQVRGRVS